MVVKVKLNIFPNNYKFNYMHHYRYFHKLFKVKFNCSELESLLS